MRAAFYAPLKPLNHPRPSGDREIGRLIVRALEDNGIAVETASTLRSWMGSPDPQTYDRLTRTAGAEAANLIARWAPDPPDIWVTYHLYHKAPDWIGPTVSKALRIPYVAIEASRSLKRQTGPWADWFSDADRALDHADGLISFHQKDLNGLKTLVPDEKLHLIAPFIDTDRFSPPSPGSPASPVRLITVAMMREGDKETSYRCLSDALGRLDHMSTDQSWHLTIIGDGPARPRLEPLFDPARCTFLGGQTPDAIPALLAKADLFVWPAINEAFGMVFLEAQAAGLPILAGRTGGVPDIVKDGETGLLSPVGDDATLAKNLSRLINNIEDRRVLSEEAIQHIRANHSLEITGRSLANRIRSLVGRSLAGQSLAGQSLNRKDLL